jgi:hypothetical protein
MDFIYFLRSYLILFDTLLWFESKPELGAGGETSVYRLRPKVLAPCGSGSSSTTLATGTCWGHKLKMWVYILFVEL